VGSGYWVKQFEEVPLVPTDDPADFDWYPLQHHFGLSAFGINVFGGERGIELVHEHDETESGQEEVYVVVAGAARFTLAGEDVEAAAGSVVVVKEPSVRRAATSVAAGTLLLAVGGQPGSFATTWRPQNFERVPVAD
jgi:quercetin dioxygenase-like cupin family protein